MFVRSRVFDCFVACLERCISASLLRQRRLFDTMVSSKIDWLVLTPADHKYAGSVYMRGRREGVHEDVYAQLKNRDRQYYCSQWRIVRDRVPGTEERLNWDLDQWNKGMPTYRASR